MFKCMACGGADSTLIYRGCVDYYLGKDYRADYFRCAKCSLVQQHPLPPAEKIPAFYDAYPIHQRKSPLYDFMRWLLMGRVYFRPPRLSGPSASAPTVIDFGCGDGSFLAWIRRRQPELVLGGFELSPAQARALTQALGVPVESDPQVLRNRWEGRADWVTLHYVLEHVTDLPGTFLRVHELLKRGGGFYFVVPHFDSLERRLFGPRWHNLDSPRHISFPDDRSLAWLAGAHGFTIERAKNVAFPNGFAGSLAVWRGRFRFPLFLLALPLGVIFSRIFPGGSRAYWLRKI